MPFGTLSKDMQLTRPEFEKRLPNALDGYDWQTIPSGIEAQNGARVIYIHVTELEPRRIGMIVLPRCRVDFSFEGFDEEQKQAFIKRFDRIYQKGGG